MKRQIMNLKTDTSAQAPEQQQGILRRFKSDQKGIAAMEFALIVPIMIGLYFMLSETANGLRASRKVTMVSRVMADLASRPATLTDADRNDMFASAGPILAPFSATTGSFRVSSIRFDADGKGFVDWSEVQGSGVGPKFTRCTPTEVRPSQPGLPVITVPAGLKIPNTSVILAEAQVKYQPVVGYNITGVIDLSDKLYMRPRASDFVTRNGVTNLPCVY
jgi:Flp pilus assembly protein TadG